MIYLLIGGQKGGTIYEADINEDGRHRIPREADIITKSFSGFLGYEDPFDEYEEKTVTHRLNGNVANIRALVLIGLDDESLNTLMEVYLIKVGDRGYKGPQGMGEVIEWMEVER